MTLITTYIEIIQGVRKKPPEKTPPKEVRARVRNRLGLGLGPGFFPGEVFPRTMIQT